MRAYTKMASLLAVRIKIAPTVGGREEAETRKRKRSKLRYGVIRPLTPYLNFKMKEKIKGTLKYSLSTEYVF